MMNFIKTYKMLPWPKLEIPPMRRSHKTGLILFTLAIIAGGWCIWFFGGIRVEKFLFLALGIPVLFLLKNRFVTIVGLLTFQVLVAFIFIGNSDYALLSVGVILGAIIAFESPIFMYIVLIGSIWYDMSPLALSHASRTEFVIGFGLLIGWIFRDLLRPKAEVIKIHFPEKWLALFFLLWAGTGLVLWSPDALGFGWVQMKWLLVGITFFIITPLVIRNEKHLDMAIIGWVGVGLIAAIATYLAPMLGFTYEKEEYAWGDAPSTLGVHKNVASQFMSLSFFVILGCFHRIKGFLYKSLAILSWIFLFVTIAYQQSKGTILGLGIGFVIFWVADTLLNARKKGGLRVIARFFLLFLAATILIISIYFIGMGEALGGYSNLFYFTIESPTIQARIWIWDISYRMIFTENHVLRGLGPGAFWTLGQQYGLPLSMDEDDITALHCHNMYLDIFLHLGVPGLVAFLLILGSTMTKLWRGFLHFNNPKFHYLCLGFFCGLVGFCVQSLLDFGYSRPNAHWLYMALALVIVNIGKKREAYTAHSDESLI